MMTPAFEFEWDDDKAAANARRPGRPTFAYATRVFLDPDAIEFDVSRQEDDEVRRKAVGMIEGRLFVVVFTDRGPARRIISARRCNGKETMAYGAIHPRSR